MNDVQSGLRDVVRLVVVMIKRCEFLVDLWCESVDEFLECGEGGDSGAARRMCGVR